MHPLIDENMVESIRSTGNAYAPMPDRAEVMDRYGLPCDRRAENVIVTGCQLPDADVLVRANRSDSIAVRTEICMENLPFVAR